MNIISIKGSVFCLDIVDYNNTSFNQLNELKVRTKHLLKYNIKVFNMEYELPYIICFKATTHFICYLIRFPFNHSDLKSNFS